jgi:hypothetical protein
MDDNSFPNSSSADAGESDPSLESLAAGLDRDDLSSARTLYQAGRGSYDRGDVQNARLYFGLAEKLFRSAEEASDAYIAKEWYNSLSQRAPSV